MSLSDVTEVGHYLSFLGAAWDVAVAGDYAYVADDTVGLQVLQFYGAAVEESHKPQVASHKLAATVIRCLPAGAVAFDAMGRRVVNPKSGILFIREPSAVGRQPSAVTKVVLQR